jgi:hypothetical protein
MLAALLLQMSPQVEVRMLSTPQLFAHDGKTAVVYELGITNYEGSPLEIKKIRIDSDGKTIQSNGSDQILAMMPGWVKAAGLSKPSLPPGGTTLVYVWADAPERSPSALPSIALPPLLSTRHLRAGRGGR